MNYVTDSETEELMDTAPETESNIVSRADFMDESVRGTPYDYAGGSRPDPMYDHLQTWTTNELETEYKSSGIAHKIVSKPAEDATRNGFRILIPENIELQEKYQTELNKLGLREKLAEELRCRALYGDGFLSIGTTVQEGTENNLYEPIDIDNLVGIPYVHAFGNSGQIADVQLNTNPSSPEYLKEVKLVINTPKNADKVTKEGNVENDPTNDMDKVVLDSTRYFRSTLDRFENDKWGTSLLNRCRDAIQTMDTALFANIKMARNYNMRVYKSKKLATTRDPKLRQQYRDELAYGLTTGSLIAIDADEDFSNVSTNVSGIDNIYNFAWQNLASACGIPKSILTGEQAGTLAGASQDVINYYDTVRATQEEILKPQIEYITRLLMYSQGVAGGRIDPDEIKWSIEFTPLWSADDKTQSETLLNIAKAIQTLVSCGTIDTDEASEMLHAQSSNANVNAIQAKQDALQELDSIKLTEKDIRDYVDTLQGLEARY